MDIEDLPIMLSEDFADNNLADWSTYTPSMLRQPKHPALFLPRGRLETLGVFNKFHAKLVKELKLIIFLFYRYTSTTYQTSGFNLGF